MSENTNTLPQPSLAPLPTTPANLVAVFDCIGLDYKIYDHDPIFTVEEGLHLKASIPGVHCRNLFLRDKKKKMALVVAANETEIDLKKLPELIDLGRVSFGSADRLWDHLGIRQGSVNPFCAINDTDHAVPLVLDAAMMEADIVNYHPMDNAQTVGISPAALLKFLDHVGATYKVVDLSPAAP
jgi:Ala-tRNA(Pro) deacylase